MTKKWLETRKSYLNKLRSQVRIITGGQGEPISDYAKSNEGLYSEIWERSSEEDFFEDLNSKKIILCGDFHSSPAVKKFYTKLLKKILETADRKVSMGLECFEKNDQSNFDLWLKGGLSEEDFLERVGWAENWGFSWGMYKKFILKMYDLGVEMFCINSFNPSFKERDQEIAENLLKAQKKNKEGVLFCLIGQHHLGPVNLKKNLETLGLETSCLHLDPEELYFTVSEYDILEKVNVLKNKEHFCFLNTPPWVHWQNHLLFLNEYLDDEDEYEVEDYRDYSEVVFEYIKLICRDLEIPMDGIKPVAVSFIDEYELGEDFGSEIYDLMEPMLDSETSFYWPQQQQGIMVVNSLNHAASVAGRYLHSKLMGVEKLPWGEVEHFDVWCWLEAVSHMLSKFINPKRQPVNIHNLSAFLSARLGEEASKKLMKDLILDRVKELKTEEPLLKSKMDWNELIYAARLKGALVGESLFELYLRREITAQTLKTYMSVPVTDSKCFEPFYSLILNNLNAGFEQE